MIHDSSGMILSFIASGNAAGAKSQESTRVDVDSSYSAENEPEDVVEPDQRARHSALMHQ